MNACGSKMYGTAEVFKIEDVSKPVLEHFGNKVKNKESLKRIFIND